MTSTPMEGIVGRTATSWAGRMNTHARENLATVYRGCYVLRGAEAADWPLGPFQNAKDRGLQYST
jgi:hypothetical protein